MSILSFSRSQHTRGILQNYSSGCQFHYAVVLVVEVAHCPQQDHGASSRQENNLNDLCPISLLIQIDTKMYKERTNYAVNYTMYYHLIRLPSGEGEPFCFHEE